ncbi:MAG: protein translocase subunit SecD [Alphaproteobacteria bacterium]
MVQISRWKMFFILAVCVYGFAYSSPNLMSAEMREVAAQYLPGWMPHKTVNLGLDLRGGAHLLYEVDMDQVFKERAETLAQDYNDYVREEELSKKTISAADGGVRIEMADTAGAQQIRSMIRRSDPRLSVESGEDDLSFRVIMDDRYIDDVQDQVISQVIEVVRRRIDETGTTEPIIQRQGERRVLIQVPGASSEQVRALVGRTAKLGFHLVPDSGRKSFRDMNLPYADEPGRDLVVRKNAIVSGDMLDDAQPSFNVGGQAVVSFRLNSVGSRKFCDVTRKNVNKPFAIVLDNEVISAPRINEAICGGRGQISGGFDVKEAQDLALLLRAGALPADLRVVEERTVGPSLGADSVQAGQTASIIGMVLVLIFMLVSYGFFGLLANLALLVNIGLILALLSNLQATLTLPGIAGIVLTVGMAVDANVLVFERIREEFAKGRSAISSVDAGYSHAMSTIVDSNLTTLIAAAILFSVGTGPVRGFAVTLAIGIVTSLFSAIMVTRLLIVLWLQRKKPKELPL